MEARTSPALVTATGHDYDHWFAALDAWGAGDRASAEARAWLRDEQGLSAWWAQKVVVEYEQVRGTRVPGARPDGTITVGVSRTVAAPPADVYAAIVDPARRHRWLPDVPLEPRRATPNRSARFDGPDGTRVTVSIDATGTTRATVSIEQERLPIDTDREPVRAAWAGRLEELRRLLTDGA